MGHDPGYVSVSGPGASAPADMAAIRDRMVNASFVVLIALGPPSLLGSILRSREVGWHLLFTVQAAVMAAFLVTFLFRRRIPYRAKVAILMAGGFALGLGGLMTWGLIGGGFLAFSAVSSLTAILLGFRAGLVTALITFLCCGAVGLAVVSGWIGYSLDFNAYALSTRSWINAMSLYGAMVGVVVGCLGKMHDALCQGVRDVQDHARRMEVSKEKLENEIRQREEAEAALKASEEKHRTILETLEEGYYEVDLAGRLTFMNQAMSELFGWPAKELLGAGYRKYVAPDEASRVEGEFNKVFRTGTPNRITRYRVVRQDGEERTLETSISLVRDPENRPTGFRGVIRDVTGHLAMEAEKSRLEEQLFQAQKWEAVGALAGGVAHDFNNLLMGIQGNVSLLLLDEDEESAAHDRLKNIETYIRDATGLTSQLLGFARAGKYQVLPTDANFLVKKTSSLFARTRKDLVIRLDMKSSRAVEVDRGQIEQVLLNLYVNAWQAMPDGGELSISTCDEVPDPRIVLAHGAAPGRYVRLDVRDTGKGMDKKTLKRIFDPFFTTKEMARGTGLGLASAWGIVKSHNGFITVESRVDRGTTFHVYLPASDKAPVPERSFVPEILYGTETVLLVDDEESVLRAGMDILEALGYTVFGALSGERALDLVQKKRGRIDLVILDMIMPGMNGAQVFEALSKLSPRPRVLVSSGYSLDGQAQELLARGCQGFIQKPFSLEELSRKLREILDVPAPQPEP
ncbi:MAG: PAS domain S-box protein [Proteobacteria bacterium]|nr:PAS domain S-box protein [Pseudomonadota bacterium]